MPRYFYRGLLVAIVGGIVAGFIYKTTVLSPEVPNVPSDIPMREAQFGRVSLKLDYATTPEARERGLGGRTEIQKDYGMLFVFPKDDTYGFWMRDMLVPIDIFWLDINGQVVSIVQDAATSTYPNVFYPSAPARYVLETVAGFAHEHSIATGTPLLLKNFPTVTK